MVVAATFITHIPTFNVGDEQGQARFGKVNSVIKVNIPVDDDVTFSDAHRFGDLAPYILRQSNQILAVRAVGDFLAGIRGVLHDGFAVIRNAKVYSYARASEVMP